MRRLLCVALLTSFGQTGVAKTLRVPGQFATLRGALEAASPDDVVLVRSGTYVERVRLKPGVTLRSEGDDRPGKLGLARAEATVIDGGGENRGSVVTLAEGSVIDGFTVKNRGRFDERRWNEHFESHGEQQSHQEIETAGAAAITATGVDCVVRNNVVHDNDGPGISIAGTNEAVCAPIVEQNVCFRNMGAGIAITRHASGIVTGNTCFENFFAGIGHDQSSPLTSNNACYGNIRAGIGISHGACPVVRGNRCYQNRRAGIGCRSGAATRPVIEDNDCYENGRAGIGSELEAAPVIRGNRCYRNKLAGIGSRTESRPTIVDNECYQNKKAGIGQESGAETTLIHNHCHHNEEAGIGFAACESGRSTVIDNRVSDNAKVAVGIHSGWRVRLVGNELSRADGMPPVVMVFAGAEAMLSNNTLKGPGVAGVRVGGVAILSNNQLLGGTERTAGPHLGVWGLPGSSIRWSGNQAQGWRHALQAAKSTVIVHGKTMLRPEDPVPLKLDSL